MFNTVTGIVIHLDGTGRGQTLFKNYYNHTKNTRYSVVLTILQ